MYIVINFELVAIVFKTLCHALFVKISTFKVFVLYNFLLEIVKSVLEIHIQRSKSGVLQLKTIICLNSQHHSYDRFDFRIVLYVCIFEKFVFRKKSLVILCRNSRLKKTVQL